MGVITTAVVVVGGLLAAARALLVKPPEAPDGFGEDSPTAVSTRGTYVPVYYGVQKTKRVLIGYAGSRSITRESTGGGGGKGGGGGGGSEQKIIYEKVWHILGYGAASELLAIRFNGKTVYESTLTAETTPSGTEINLGKEGSFQIYWGEKDQQVNTTLGREIGYDSRHPGVCYIFWTRMRYGTTASQPQVEYVLNWKCEGVTLSSSDYYIPDNDFFDGVLATGINPAHISHLLLTGPAGLGAAIGKEKFDNTSLEQWGQDAETEHLPVNMSMVDGPTVQAMLQALLQDMGYFMVQAGKHFAFLPQRFSSDTAPVLTDDVVVPPDNPKDKNLVLGETTKPVFTFKNAKGYTFRDQDIAFDDDGEASGFGLSTAKRIEINTVTDLVTASKVARRRSQEPTVKTIVKLKCLRGARRLLPGQRVNRPGLGLMRVLGVKWSDESPVTELSLTPDTYGVPDIEDIADIPTSSDNQRDPAADLVFKAFELPTDLQQGTTLSVVVFRVRAHDQILTSDIHLSTNATSYTNVGTQEECNGATLDEAIASSTDELIVDGPEMEPLNDDFNTVLDLSGNTAEWQQGKQVALLGNEVFYIEKFEAVDEEEWESGQLTLPGTFVRPTTASPSLRFKSVGLAATTGTSEPTWPTTPGETVNDNGVVWEAHRFAFKAKNMIRARQGTSAQSHSIGDTMLIANADLLQPFTLQGFTIGQLICVKSQPRTTAGAVDLATVSAECLTLEGDSSDTSSYRSTPDGPRVTATGDRRVTG